MSTALYRRYRPDSFEDVIGQDHVTRALETALSTSRVAHAYLFSGPRGCGKTTSARILARSLNCAEGPTPTPCGSCESCLELASGGPGTLDVVEIDAASHGGVEDARDLRERLTFAPARDRYRIFILDEAHMVTPQGFNALLKAVEEPPPHVKFIFATTEPDKVLSTIRSRTHHYPFRLVPPNVLVPYLKTIGEREGVELDDTVLQLVVRAGGGSVRDSLSVLDQLIAGSDGKVSHEHAVRLLGYTDAALLDDIVDALGNNDGAAVFDQVGELIEAGVDPHQFVEDLLQRLRDLMVCALAGDRAEDILEAVPADQYANMRRQAEQWGSPLLSRRADIVEDAVREMAGATAPRLQLELLLARMLVDEPGGAVSSGATRAQPQASGTDSPVTREKPAASAQGSRPGDVPASGLESGVTEPPRTASAPTVPTAVPAPTPPSPAAHSDGRSAASAPSKDEVRQKWGPILAFLGQSSAMLTSLMQAVRDVSAEGNTVVFSMREQLDVDRFQRAGGEERLSQALTQIFDRPLKGAVRAVGAPPPPPTGRPQQNVEPAPRRDAPADGAQAAPRQAVNEASPRVALNQHHWEPEEPPEPEHPEPEYSAPSDHSAPEAHGGPPQPASTPVAETPESAASESPAATPIDTPVENARSADSEPARGTEGGLGESAVSEPAPSETDGDDYAQYRGRQPVDLVTDILGGQVIEEVIEEPEEE